MNGHCLPVVRMSNTYIAPGELSFDEMIKDIDEGIFMAQGHWGYVFCERGQYTCHAGEGWTIKNGQLAEHLRDVSFSGMTLETLMNIDAIGDDFVWSACVAGRAEMPICSTALAMGGNARVGMEDNLWLSRGVPAKSNAELVEKIISIAHSFSLETATPDEAREILGIKGTGDK